MDCKFNDFIQHIKLHVDVRKMNRWLTEDSIWVRIEAWYNRYSFTQHNRNVFSWQSYLIFSNTEWNTFVVMPVHRHIIFGHRWFNWCVCAWKHTAILNNFIGNSSKVMHLQHIEANVEWLPFVDDIFELIFLCESILYFDINFTVIFLAKYAIKNKVAWRTSQ